MLINQSTESVISSDLTERFNVGRKAIKCNYIAAVLASLISNLLAGRLLLVWQCCVFFLYFIHFTTNSYKVTIESELLHTITYIYYNNYAEYNISCIVRQITIVNLINQISV